jgi:transposase
VPAPCHDLIEQLLQRLNVLEERVNLNSRNSSKPPSSDGPGTPPRTPKAQSGKRLGGQPGHQGSFRAPLPEDKLTSKVLCPPPPQCTACGGAVSADGDKPIRHQVFELPKIEPIVTEYVRLRGVCSGCGQKHHGALPAGVPSGQLGPRALALVGTLAGQFHLTQRKVQDVLSHIMGIRFSLGAVSHAHGLVSQALAAPVAQLQAELVLCLQDTTELDYNGQQIQGLGPLSYEAQRGLYLHPTYVVTPQREPLGVTNAWMWAREFKDGDAPRGGPLESRRWIESYEIIAEQALKLPKRAMCSWATESPTCSP